MDNKDKYIEGLFDKARSEAPQTSFEDIQAQFDANISGSNPGNIPSTGKGTITFKSIIIMVGTIISVVVGVLVFVAPSDQINESPKQAEIHEPVVNRSTYKSIEIIEEEPDLEEIIVDGDTSSIFPEHQFIQVNTKEENGETISDTVVEIAPRKRPKTKINHFPDQNGGLKSKVSSKEDSLKMVEILITDRTTVEELERIADRATKAGIEFNYKQRGRIKKSINVEMSITTDDARYSRSESQIRASGKFELYLSWMEDENGKAICFPSDDENELFMIECDMESLFFDSETGQWSLTRINELDSTIFRLDSLRNINGRSIIIKGGK